MRTLESIDEEAGLTDEVELSLPARPELLSLARLTVAAVASRADFDYEEIEDLRLAIDELCSPLVGSARGEARLGLRYEWDHDSLLVAATGGVATGEDTDEYDLSDRILDALVDEHGRGPAGEGVCVWLRKRRRATVAGA